MHAERRTDQIRGGRHTPDSARRKLRLVASAPEGGPSVPKGERSGFGADGARRIPRGADFGGAPRPREATFGEHLLLRDPAGVLTLIRKRYIVKKLWS
jgi:hypothetical protein